MGTRLYVQITKSFRIVKLIFCFKLTIVRGNLYKPLKGYKATEFLRSLYLHQVSIEVSVKVIPPFKTKLNFPYIEFAEIWFFFIIKLRRNDDVIRASRWGIHWLYVLFMSRTRFRVNPYSIVAWMSRNSLLEAGAISKVWVTANGLEPRTT